MATKFLSAPCKKGWDVDFKKPFKTFIQETYSDEQASGHSNAIEEFNSLRNKCIAKLNDRHETTIQLFERYHDQLFAIETKIPITENSVRIDFRWQDAFAKESLFGGKTNLKLSLAGWDRMCMLFNLGALYSQLGESVNFSDDKGLQTAAKFFQQSAGMFSYVASVVTLIIQREPTPDMSGDALNALKALMIAQAQDCIYQKASKDKMKAGIVCRIAMQAADLYADALKLLQLNSLKNLWPKDWVTIVAGKQAGFHALAELYQSRACADSQSYGEQIARLRKAGDLMKSAAQRAGTSFLYKDDQQRIKSELESAEKENNMIYHDTIPDTKNLSTVGKAVIAKETIPEFPLTKGFVDLFDKLVPMAVHHALTNFENTKKMMASGEVGRLREATDFINSVMSSLNLPAGLEDTSGSAIPPSLLTKSAEIREKGGIDNITTKLQNLPSLLQRNKEILEEAIRLLDEEAESDTKLRTQFGARWTRTASADLTVAWRTEADKFRSIVEQATNSDKIVRDKFAQHENGIRLMSKTEGEMRAALPQGGASSGQGNQSVKDELRQICNEVEALKSERKEIENQINNLSTESIGAQFTQALAEDGAMNQNDFTSERLNEVYAPLREKVRQSVEQQESLLARLQAKNSEFQGGNDGAGASRAQLLGEMAAAYDHFMQLIENLEEGSKFYGSLTELFLKYQSKIQDFVFARKTEKDELMKDLQRSITSEKTEMSSAPQFQATTPGTDTVSTSAAVPPPRPPATYKANQPPAPQQQQPYKPDAPPPPPHQQQQQPPVATYGAPPQNQPGMPYPSSPYGMPQPFMPQAPVMPGYMGGGYAPPPQPYYPGYAPSQGYQQPPQGYQQPPHGYQQPPQGYQQGYPYQAPQQQGYQYPQQQPGYNPQWPPR